MMQRRNSLSRVCRRERGCRKKEKTMGKGREEAVRVQG